MKDRVPLYPGRVKLTPVSGQENTYDMVRADEPTQEGTPLSKATFLKDATAALFGLGGDAVPDDVLSEIKSVLNSQDNDIASKAKIATGSYVGTGKNGNVSLTFDFEPKFIFIQSENSYKQEYFLGVVGGYGFLVYRNGTGTSPEGGNSVKFWSLKITISGTTVSFYGGLEFLNIGTTTYSYFAIG